ncbi:PepSY-associated TM helix domain-containing protein [Gilvimarinus sp. 1_MG-2023]|uniref:PepSY-associated TM helix domain-containing protein n=1 Tax=Gilvimarinus sp. 1_MG-2023 TaxID=3062638 RepID=UPI0026E1B9E1|nr:PepSY-associated TM helix domain-containing protein [Gilvimarinus sp. 1_MG-2023]MDO6745828.1 PepSY-associated TM helix domain-containing protein [Gilvimarinus sp. 1_MG-2023]
MRFGSLRQWHWVSSAICLIGLLLFAITGITLNHAHQIPAQKSTLSLEARLDPQLLTRLELENIDSGPLPKPLRLEIRRALGVYINSAIDAEWYGDEIYVPLPRPGGDAWMSIDINSGEAIYEKTTRGVVAYLNDLHKGRNTGVAWSWFIDVFAIACLVFSLTGLWLLIRLQKSRPGTWPMVAFGLVAPLIIIILFVH